MGFSSGIREILSNSRLKEVGRISFFFEDTARVRIRQEYLRKVIRGVAQNEGRNSGVINVILCSDEALLSMNREYLKHDFYTDIITFDNTEGFVLSGELYISLDRIRDNAAAYGVDYRVELTRVVIHGVLHLAGYGDKRSAEKKTMKAREDFYLRMFDTEQVY